MVRNIVVCCDGTANEFATDNTNVVKLYYALEQSPYTQVTYYHPGIGTMEPAGALTTFSRKFTKLLGMAVGYGLPKDILDAYTFVISTFQPGDRLYMFGFSRGAYTVRAVASLLKMYGLINSGNQALVPYATRMMMAIERADKDNEKEQAIAKGYFELAADFKITMGRVECKPYFVGVWDTVSSVGWVENPLHLPYVANNPDIQIGRHAVSIDERRAFFRNHLWRRPADPQAAWGPQDVKQVWFPGVHCDVGGGYAEAESGLSKVTLEWMLAEAKAAGLLVNTAREQEVLGHGVHRKYISVPDPNGQIHESLRGWWNLAEIIPKKHYDWKTGQWGRRMNLWRRRTIPVGPEIHSSVSQRRDYTPKNLP